jgi:hypothetical protein
VAIGCAKILKERFSKVGACSSVQNFIRGDPDRVIQWINGETEAFEEILSDIGDFCAFAGARGAVSVLEKVSSEHAKVLVQTGFSLQPVTLKTLWSMLLHLKSFIPRYG